jgi:hypothetical protein
MRGVRFGVCASALLSVALVGSVAGCAEQPVTWWLPSNAPVVVHLPAGMGAVVGGIARCYDMPPPPSEQRFVGGRVDVYRGGYIDTNSQVFESKLVAADTQYILVLRPGIYVLVGTTSGTNLQPPEAQVTITAGNVTSQDLAYEGCI